MSIYCFEDVYGEIHELPFPMTEVPDEVMTDSGRAVRLCSWAFNQRRDRFTGSQKGWPVESYGLGVHPDDRFSAMDHAQKSGVPTEYNENGNPILRNPSHARRFRKLCGAHDRDGFFG